MIYDLIKTNDYLLMIDNQDNNNNNLECICFYYYNHLFNIIGKHFDFTMYNNNNFTYKVLAHLPINNVPTLDDLNLLPPLDSNDIDPISFQCELNPIPNNKTLLNGNYIY